jgi:glyoxylate/hydroxypyruvate reductase
VFNAPITGKTVIVIGVGAMGGAAARRAKSMKMRVLGVRRSGRPHRYVDEMFRPEELEKILPRADFVLVTAPLTAATRGLLGRKQLDMLRSEAGLINMGRAGLIDYEALGEKLTRGELSGAMLDVFDPEPLPEESPLWSTPNLIITPHVSSDALDHTPRTLDLFFENLKRYLAGRGLLNEVSAAQGY